MSLYQKVFRKNKEEKKQSGALAKITKGKVIGLMFMFLMLISPASATEVNWSEITAVIDGFVGIVPSFASMISAVMPVLLVIAMYTFIMRFWDKILDGIDSAFHFK